MTAKNQNLYQIRINTEKNENNLYKPEINEISRKIVKLNLNRSVDGGKINKKIKKKLSNNKIIK
jgi:hypothetical protein